MREWDVGPAVIEGVPIAEKVPDVDATDSMALDPDARQNFNLELLVWGRQMASGNRHVASTRLWRWWISTVWLPAPPRVPMRRERVLAGADISSYYETMVFASSGAPSRSDGGRCAERDDAAWMHVITCGTLVDYLYRSIIPVLPADRRHGMVRHVRQVQRHLQKLLIAQAYQ